ncbi:b(0,+)-type amino acid transporter 1-like [Platysternon megacephalum]|uniref:B(0,+)-type amino acid transporter 1-like n=1 Tax=Platysternon megacephalum TaxID=55544 RepID=A0A4D9DSK6_9SAUR|nr:b(0,+)-type amino acid transporter 1-like [Platysternon megacephalum]
MTRNLGGSEGKFTYQLPLPKASPTDSSLLVHGLWGGSLPLHCIQAPFTQLGETLPAATACPNPATQPLPGSVKLPLADHRDSAGAAGILRMACLLSPPPPPATPRNTSEPMSQQGPKAGCLLWGLVQSWGRGLFSSRSDIYTWHTWGLSGNINDGDDRKKGFPGAGGELKSALCLKCIQSLLLYAHDNSSTSDLPEKSHTEPHTVWEGHRKRMRIKRHIFTSRSETLSPHCVTSLPAHALSRSFPFQFLPKTPLADSRSRLC